MEDCNARTELMAPKSRSRFISEVNYKCHINNNCNIANIFMKFEPVIILYCFSQYIDKFDFYNSKT